ncbi:hypothetical protein PIB30_026230 [Stylosanthes scabra]|uniref:Uncharacterized protein n=1 Tax=Stylosanthes scabra TaxID=79078 RepID=A0ABU6Q9Z1_9FABA|nr:hypothetical protein [Stylosanthes scabra]
MKVNLEKSKAVCSKIVSSRRQDLLRRVSNIRFVNALGKYLGVNLNHGWPSRVACMESVEKIRKRLVDLSFFLLSFVPKLIRPCASSYGNVILKVKPIWVSLGFGLIATDSHLNLPCCFPFSSVRGSLNQHCDLSI